MATTTQLPVKKGPAKEATPFERIFEGIYPFAMTWNRLFDDLWAGGRRWPFDGPQSGPAEGAWMAPAIDVREDEDAFAITAELPGLSKDEVRIQFEDGVLTISGEKKVESEKKGRTWHRMERRYGRFSRSVALPASVDVDAADAKFEGGVLEIRVPKTEASKPKTVAIK